ncbi:MAG: ABC transporter substrate-binding protein, partial [Proteobacteria bacterium]|nr:ABC transporter substrate-binding protein [Pseudomonadota bacterium]
MAPPRIVSLLPSTTEIACALGFRDALVGRSHECDFPPGIEILPVCTRARFEDGTSGEIDDRVRDLVQRGLSVYHVDAERLRALAPDVILTQDQCEVCAVSVKDLEDALRQWTGGLPRVVSLSPQTLGDVWGDIRRVGAALGAPERAEELVVELTNRVTEIGEQTGDTAARPTVACIEWIDPLMAAGNWVPELVTLAGGRDPLGQPGAPSAWIEWETLRRIDPDVVLLLPCGFDLARTRAELPTLLASPG